MTSPTDTQALVERAKTRASWLGEYPRNRLKDATLIDALLALIASLQKELAETKKERDDARRNLFPYADATEISGYSTTGIYLIGDRASIKAAEKAFHYSAQIDEYRVAFDERIKAAESRADALAKKVEGQKSALLTSQKIVQQIVIAATEENGIDNENGDRDWFSDHGKQALVEIGAALEQKP